VLSALSLALWSTPATYACPGRRSPLPPAMLRRPNGPGAATKWSAASSSLFCPSSHAQSRPQSTDWSSTRAPCELMAADVMMTSA
jgi:hypothetical protein